MRLRFNGGPWDGVEFDSPICPNSIGCRDLNIGMEVRQLFDGEAPSKSGWIMDSRRRDHHQYLFDQPKIKEGIDLKVGENLSREPEDGDHLIDLVDPELLVYHYRYAPYELSEWETDTTGCQPFFPPEKHLA